MMDPVRALDKIWEIVNSFHAAGFLYSSAQKDKEKPMGYDHNTHQDIPDDINNPELLQFFTYDHLPPHLQAISKCFAELASTIVILAPNNPERTVALRKLLEAKDCAVRAMLYKP